VFENRFLRRIFGPKRDEVTGEWGKLHNEELHNLYSSPDIIRQVKSRRMRWAGHVARMGEEIKYTRFWWENHFDSLSPISLNIIYINVSFSALSMAEHSSLLHCGKINEIFFC
jgi:hypothetical protein